MYSVMHIGSISKAQGVADCRCCSQTKVIVDMVRRLCDACYLGIRYPLHYEVRTLILFLFYSAIDVVGFQEFLIQCGVIKRTKIRSLQELGFAEDALIIPIGEYTP